MEHLLLETLLENFEQLSGIETLLKSENYLHLDILGRAVKKVLSQIH